MMTPTLPRALAFLAVLALPAAAQDLLRPRATTRPLHGAELAGLQLASGEAQALTLPDRVTTPLEVGLRLDGQDVRLRLRPHSMRAPDFRLLVADGTGQLTERTPPPVTTVRGEVLGRPGSIVAGNLADGRLEGTVVLEPGTESWSIQPLAGDAPAPASLLPGAVEHAVYPASAVVDPGGVCGAVVPPGIASSGWLPATSEGSAPSECEIALEADFPFFQLNGSSVAATAADIEGVINGVEGIYLADVAITYAITSILVHTANDPYTSTDSGVLLTQFRDEWLDNQSAIVRDIAHLFTGRNIDGSIIGIAYVGVICNAFSGFGLSQSLFTPNIFGRVALTAHELGHNWNAPHCDGDQDCNIMCSGLGGCSGEVTSFGSASVASISGHKALADCLELVVPDPEGGPVVTALAPDYGPSDGGTAVVVNGADFVDGPETTVQFDGADATIVSIAADSIVVEPPPGLAGKRVDILVSDGTGGTLLADGFSYEFSINTGDRARSSLSAANDIDRAYFEAPAGALLTANLRRRGPLGAALVPGLRLLGPGEAELIDVQDDAADPTGRARIQKFALPATGDHRLELFGVGGSVGAYRLVTKMKPVRKIVELLAVGPSTPQPSVTFGALAGTRLTSLLKARPPKGDYQTIEGQPSALLPQLVSVEGPSGPLDLTDLVSTSPNGKKLKLAALILPETGDYTVTLAGADGSVGFGRLRLRIKPPKTPSVQHESDPELE